jgi:hypothetical protein
MRNVLTLLIAECAITMTDKIKKDAVGSAY